MREKQERSECNACLVYSISTRSFYEVLVPLRYLGDSTFTQATRRYRLDSGTYYDSQVSHSDYVINNRKLARLRLLLKFECTFLLSA
jgi:hypothetical protein